VAEALGAVVEWDQKTNTATVQKWSEKIHLTVGKKTALVEGRLLSRHIDMETVEDEIVDVSVPVKAVKKRVYLPLRFVSQQLGYRVSWDKNTVSIQSPHTEQQRKTLYEGDLDSARSIASGAMRYELKPLNITRSPEVYDKTYLFPEGEALRYYYIYGNVISLVQIKEDFPVVVWQAYLTDEILSDQIQSFFKGKVTGEQGKAQSIDKPFLYHTSGISGFLFWSEYGRFERDDTYTQTGYRGSSVDGNGVISTGLVKLELPGEKRTDARSLK